MILSTLTALWLIATGPAHVPVMDAPQFACITAAGAAGCDECRPCQLPVYRAGA